MKFIFLAGGCAGFLAGAGASFWVGHAPDRVFFDGAAGCLAGALLFRWFWSVLVRGIQETVLARHSAGAAKPK